jgi:hypothetical protein
MKRNAWIGVRVEALLDGYWRDKPHQSIKEEIIADWIAALEFFSQDEIRKACREYLSSDRRDKKPKPGDIRAIIIARKPPIRKNDDRPMQRLTAQDLEARRASAARILDEIWRADDGKA